MMMDYITAPTSRKKTVATSPLLKNVLMSASKDLPSLLVTDFSNNSKYLDSHLRPYRCKDEKCASLEFSSNACLFRHEREAHGMHGHGDNPYPCHFRDCDRAKPGQGFPRRWNLWDHMKRVHDYKPAEEERKTAASKQSSRVTGVRKRKPTSGPAPGSVPMKRSTSSQSKTQAKSVAVIQAQNSRRLQETRQNASNVKSRLMDQIQSLDITNQDDIASANASLQELQTYQYEFRQLQPFGLDGLDLQYSG